MKNIYFFIGTEAELIKVFPIIIKCQELGGVCHIIASGQNNLKKNRIFDCIELNGRYIELSDEESIKKSALGLLVWFVNTRLKAVKIITNKVNKNELKGKNLVVHGDTISTYMGAQIGRKLGMVVCHVEAGLRSHNILNPFPEEIDRLLTSRISRVHFAPSGEAEKNLFSTKGRIINTEYNTILDSLEISKNIPIMTLDVQKVVDEKYFVFVMHRQENLMDKRFFTEVVKKITLLSNQIKCVVILHKITELALEDIGLLGNLQNNKNIILLPRVDYFDFMKLLKNAEFVITDGGSNQEELHYMGKPCLIMRKATERMEGIGTNAKLYDGNLEEIDKMIEGYKQMESEPVIPDVAPSEIIATYLIGEKVQR